MASSVSSSRIDGRGMANRPRPASVTISPGILRGNRKALTRTEASTTALSVMEGPGLVNGGQDLCLLLRRRLTPRDVDRPEHDRSGFGYFRFQIVAFLQPGGFPNTFGQRDLRG